tara:strand:- start:1183 stop:1344 length:162 start_codon:yes stop_codon:yes gene_type:complete
MANPNQKTILIEKAFQEIKKKCNKFRDDSGTTNLDIKNLLNNIINEFELSLLF